MSVARSKEIGSYHMMMGQNPVYIFSFGKEESSNMEIPRLMITAASSGSGKNTLHLWPFAGTEKQKSRRCVDLNADRII